MAEPVAIEPPDPFDLRVVREMLELSGDLLCVVEAGSSLTFSYVNDAWTKLLGWSVAELTRDTYLDLIHPDDVAVSAAAVQRLHAGLDVQRFRNRYRTSSGDWVWLEWCARTSAREPHAMVAIGRDVSDRRRDEQSIASLVRRLQTLVEDERGRIAGELHDYAMQTLIAALMHARSALEDPSIGNASATVPLTHALGEVERLLDSTVDSLRGVMNGLRPLWVEHLAFDDVLAQLVREMQRDFPITVDANIDVGEPVSATLRLTAYRVLREVLVNAAKHGEVADVELDVRVADGRLDATVHDAGRGFLEPIEAHETAPGTSAIVDAFGLGLNLALERVVLNGGNWQLQSAPGVGTTVQVRLPLHVDAATFSG